VSALKERYRKNGGERKKKERGVLSSFRKCSLLVS
jgi:hypothetical protein